MGKTRPGGPGQQNGKELEAPARAAAGAVSGSAAAAAAAARLKSDKTRDRASDASAALGPAAFLLLICSSQCNSVSLNAFG